MMQRLEKLNNSMLQIYPNLHSNRPLYEIIKLDPKLATCMSRVKVRKVPYC